MRSTTELFRLMGKGDAEISVMRWVYSTVNLDASPEPGNLQDQAYYMCHVLGLPKLGQGKTCFEQRLLARSPASWDCRIQG